MSTETPETGDTTVTYDEALEAGYWGTHTDPEPNETYTLPGEEAPPEGGAASSKSAASSSGSSSGSSSKASSSKGSGSS